MVRTRYKPVLNKAGDRRGPSPIAESNLNGRFEGPRKKDPAAMNSPKHMRQRCRAMRFVPRTPPLTSMRTSPTAANRHTEPMNKCQIYCGDGHGQHGRDKDFPGKDMAV